jgi:hypothetical protein
MACDEPWISQNTMTMHKQIPNCTYIAGRVMRGKQGLGGGPHVPRLFDGLQLAHLLGGDAVRESGQGLVDVGYDQSVAGTSDGLCRNWGLWGVKVRQRNAMHASLSDGPHHRRTWLSLPWRCVTWVDPRWTARGYRDYTGLKSASSPVHQGQLFQAFKPQHCAYPGRRRRGGQDSIPWPADLERQHQSARQSGQRSA